MILLAIYSLSLLPMEAWAAAGRIMGPEGGQPIELIKVAIPPPALGLPGVSGAGLSLQEIGTIPTAVEGGPQVLQQELPVLQQPTAALDQVVLPGEVPQAQPLEPTKNATGVPGALGKNLGPQDRTEAALPSLESASGPANPSQADPGAKVFDGDLNPRIFLKLPGKGLVSTDLAGLPGVLAAHPELKELLRDKGRIRLVLGNKPGAGELTRAHAALLERRMTELGVMEPSREETAGPLGKAWGWLASKVVGTHGVDVETFVPETPEPVAPAQKKDGPAPSLAQRLKNLPAKIWSLRKEPAFLARSFTASIRFPSMREALRGVAMSIPGVASNAIAFYVALIHNPLLPHMAPHWAMFAAAMSLTVGLKTFHNVLFASTWLNLQNRIKRERDIGYLRTFNLLYGVIWAGAYRSVFHAANPDKVTSPFTLSFLRDLGIVTIVGNFFGTFGGQAPNELYNKGNVTIEGRSFLQQFRSLLQDLESVVFKAGGSVFGIYGIIFSTKQLLDFFFYLYSVGVKPRPILYAASASVSATEQFQKRYLEQSTSPSVRESVRKAMEEDSFFSKILKLYNWVKKKLLGKAAGASALAAVLTISPQVLAARYKAAMTDDAAFEFVGRMPIAELTAARDSTGAPQRVSNEGLGQPWIMLDKKGDRYVFKRLKVDPDHPDFQAERMKLAIEAVSSYIMEKMGVPTVRYRVARVSVDGKIYTGVLSPYVPGLLMAKSHPELADRLSNPDDFIRGSIVDAWEGNSDRVTNEGNVWLVQEGGKEVVLFGDYDRNLQLNVRVLGVPKVPVHLFARYAKPEIMAKAITEITALSDGKIRDMVGEALAEGGFDSASSLRDYFSGVLIANRDGLKREGVFDSVLPGNKPRLRFTKEKASALADAVLKGERDPSRIPALVDESLKDMLYVQTYRPELRAPLKALLEELARRRLAGDDAPFELDDITLLPALMVFVHMRIPAEIAIGSSIGYNP